MFRFWTQPWANTHRRSKKRYMKSSMEKPIIMKKALDTKDPALTKIEENKKAHPLGASCIKSYLDKNAACGRHHYLYDGNEHRAI